MRVLTIALTLLLTACASSSASRPEPVVDAMNRFMNALNALDADAIAAQLAPDVTAFFPTAKPERVEGKAAVVAVFRDYCEQSKKTASSTNIVPQEMRVDRRGDLAVVSFQVVHPAVVSRRTFIFRLERGSWLISHLHASNIRLQD